MTDKEENKELPKIMTITIEDPDVIELLVSGEAAIVRISDVVKTMTFMKENMFADSQQELEENYDFGLVPLDVEKMEDDET